MSPPRFECLRHPRTTPRRIGRYALELWLGRELIERLRFDFPLLGSEVPHGDASTAHRDPPSFAPGARVSVTLSLPNSARANRAQLLDRATGEVTQVPWPPAAPPGVDPARCEASPRSTPAAATAPPPHPGR